MKFRIEHIIILVLLIWLVITQFFTIKPEPNTEPWKRAIAEKEVKIKELGLQNQALLKDLREDSVRQASERAIFKTQINRLSRRLDTRRPQVQPIIDSIPALKAFIQTQDSVIQTQAKRIDTLESNLQDLRIDLNHVTANFNERLKLTEQNYQDLSKIADAYQNENKKLKRRNRFKAALIPAVGALGLFLGSQL